MNKIRALVFDLDGTLINTLVSLANCYNRVLSAHGYQTHPTDAFRYFIGNGARRCLTACLEASSELGSLSGDDIEALLAAQQVDYRDTWKQNVVIYDEVLELIGSLRMRNLSIAVLTNKDQEFAAECVRHFFPNTDFHIIQGFERDVPHKPNPIGALKVARALQLSPSEIALLGDTKVDIETALAAGHVSIGALWGFRDRQELELAGAQYLVEAPLEVLKLPII